MGHKQRSAELDVSCALLWPLLASAQQRLSPLATDDSLPHEATPTLEVALGREDSLRRTVFGRRGPVVGQLSWKHSSWVRHPHKWSQIWAPLCRVLALCWTVCGRLVASWPLALAANLLPPNKLQFGPSVQCVCVTVCSFAVAELATFGRPVFSLQLPVGSFLTFARSFLTVSLARSQLCLVCRRGREIVWAAREQQIFVGF